MKKHTFILSDESENSYGFITRTSGIELAAFKKNPVMLFNHNSDDVIGYWENIRMDDHQLKADAVFDEDDPQSVMLEKKVEKGIIKGCSIGFSIKRIETGYDGKPDVISECVLKEASLTALPANENAIRLYDEDGKLLSNKNEVLQFLSANKKNNLPMKKITLSPALLTMLALTAESTDEQIEQRLTTLANEHKQHQTQNTELSQKLKEQNASRVKALVDSAIAEKRITEADRADYTALTEANYELAEKQLKKIAPVKKLSDVVNQGGTNNGVPPTAKVNSDRSTWSYHDWATNDSRGLAKLKSDNPEEFARLEQEVVREVRSKNMIED